MSGESGTRGGISVDLLTFGCIGVFMAVGVLLQTRVHINHDVSWVLHSASWLLDGKEFGRDVIEPNPPLAWYLTIPVVLLAKTTGLMPPLAMQIYVFSLTTACILLTWIVLKPLRMSGKRLVVSAILLSFAFVVLVRPGRDFGQREYLTIVMCLPYLLLVAGIVNGNVFSRKISIPVGLLAGLGFAIKPYFLIVPVGVEIYRTLATGRLRGLVRPDTCCIAGVILFYVISVFVLSPEYVSRIIPLVQSLYWGFERSVGSMLTRLDNAHDVLPLLLGLVLMVGRKPTSYEIILGIAALGFFGSFIVQMKGYSYHGFPSFAFMFVFTFAAAAETARQRGIQTLGHFVIVLILAFIVVRQSARTRSWYLRANIEHGALGQRIDRTIDIVERYASDDVAYAFSTHPFPGFPTVSYTSARWGARTNSQFVIPAILKKNRSGESLGPELVRAEIFQRQRVLKDFQDNEPAVVLVATGRGRHAIEGIEFDDIEFYSQDPNFAEIWDQYVEVDEVSRHRVFVRRDRLERK